MSVTQSNSITKYIWMVICAIAGIILLSAIFGSVYTVDEKQRGVLLTNGAFSKVVEPGLGWKFPFVQSLVIIDVQSNATQFQGMHAYSHDQQTATMNISINWSADPSKIKEIYQRFGSVENLLARQINRKVGDELEKTFGKFTAVRAVQERGNLTKDYSTALRNAIDGPILIESVQIENIDFSDAYEHSIEERMKAEVSVKTAEQVEEREIVQARIKVTQAQAIADSSLAQARAEAEAIKLRGNAEADAIRARADALKANQDLVNLTYAERWDGTLPTTMLPNSTVPFMNTSK